MLALQRLGGVARRQLEQLALVAALRDAETDGRSPTAGQETLQIRRVVGQGGQEHLRRDGGGPLVVLLHEPREHRGIVRFAGGVEQVDVTPDHLPAADGEQLDRGLVVLSSQPEHVLLGRGVGGHLLALHRPLYGPNLVAQGRRALVFGRLRRRLHLTA